MIETIMENACSIVQSKKFEWAIALESVVFCYRIIPIGGGVSPIYFLYSVPPRIRSRERLVETTKGRTVSDDVCKVQLI